MGIPFRPFLTNPVLMHKSPWISRFNHWARDVDRFQRALSQPTSVTSGGQSLALTQKALADPSRVNNANPTVLNPLEFSGSLIPDTNNVYDLGENTTPKKWRDLWLSRNATVGGTVTIDKGIIVSGTALLSGGITLSGGVTVTGTLRVTGNASFGSATAVDGAFGVTGLATLASAVATELNVTSGTTLSGVSVTGQMVFGNTAIIASGFGIEPSSSNTGSIGRAAARVGSIFGSTANFTRSTATDVVGSRLSITAGVTLAAGAVIASTSGNLTLGRAAGGNLLWNTDNVGDIGAAAATRPRDVFIGRNLGVTGNASFGPTAAVTIVGGQVSATSVVSDTLQGELSIVDPITGFAITLAAGDLTTVGAPTSVRFKPTVTDPVITLQGSPLLDDWFDQSVKTTGSPTHSYQTITNTLTANRAEVAGLSLSGHILTKKGAAVTSGTTVSLANDGNYWSMTGATTVAGLSSTFGGTSHQAGTLAIFTLASNPSFTHDATRLILRDGVTYSGSTGDVIGLISEGANNYREWFRSPASREPPYVQYTTTADKTVANTTTETTLISATGQGSLTFPANFWRVGRSLRFTVMGVHTTLDTPFNPTVRFRVKLGSTILDTGAKTTIPGTADNVFELTGVITCRSIGASGTFIGQGKFLARDTSLVGDAQMYPMGNTSTTTVDTTATITPDITVAWGTADSAITITATNVALEILGP